MFVRNSKYTQKYKHKTKKKVLKSFQLWKVRIYVYIKHRGKSVIVYIGYIHSDIIAFRVEKPFKETKQTDSLPPFKELGIARIGMRHLFLKIQAKNVSKAFACLYI